MNLDKEKDQIKVLKAYLNNRAPNNEYIQGVPIH